MGAACDAVVLCLFWYQKGGVAFVCYISVLSLCPESKSENSGDIALPLRPYLQKGGVAIVCYISISALSLCPKSKPAIFDDIALPLHSGKKNSPAGAGEGVPG